MKTQNEKLIEYLRKHWYITRLQAALRLGIMNLWVRIAELEDLGYAFDRRKAQMGKKLVLQYWLKSKAVRKVA